MPCDLEMLAKACAENCYTTKAILTEAIANADDDGAAFMADVPMKKGLLVALRTYLMVWFYSNQQIVA